MKYTSERVQAKLQNILSMLDGKSMTLREVAAKSGISIASMKHYLLYLHNRRAIYIDHYVQSGFTYAPAYMAGDKDDAPRSLDFEPKVDGLPQSFTPHRDWTASWIPTREAA